MNCVKPPLLKKPSRGFAWSCGPCSRAQERKLEARNTPNFNNDGSTVEQEEDDYYDDEEEEAGNDVATNGTTPENSGIDDSHHAGTAEQIYQASLWPYRYLGMHCKPEDALDYDDRIYPRASSRIGPKHQANVLPWPGRPVQYVKPLEIKRTGRDKRLSKEQQALLEKEKKEKESRPKWIQDEPAGYVRRGEDGPPDDPNTTSTLLWKPAEDVGASVSSDDLDIYLEKAKKMAPKFGLEETSTNLLDVARDILFQNEFDEKAALEQLATVEKSVFKEPELTTTEQKKFEEGVSKFGSELHFVMKHVKTLSPGAVVRYYYTWKKTKRGKEVWGNYSGRKVKKEAKVAEAAANKLQDDVADDMDDSAFDTTKAIEKKRAFICKFCTTKSSRQWRRAPGGFPDAPLKGKDKNILYVQALCRRCAELWRRYAVQWEDIEDVAKKVAQAGGRAWKKKVDEELLRELLAANEMIKIMDSRPYPPTKLAQPAGAATNKTSGNGPSSSSQEPPRKKLKTGSIKDTDVIMADSGTPTPPAPVPTKKKDKAVEKLAEKQSLLSVPEVLKPKVLPCAVCRQLEPLGDQHLTCKECRLAVHRNCYGVFDNRNPEKWVCDMCSNDKSPQVSIQYKCVLCPVDYTEHDFVEPPKISHKKKTEKEREKDRLERENALKAAEYYRKKQIEMNRPVNPREALKRTADNNWVHVTCAMWTPEVKFGSARAFEPCEGIPSIPQSRFSEICKVCGQKGGACVACHTCKIPVHVECAQRENYLLGFDITPVKGSRRDQHHVVSINGEIGTMSAAVWCKEHMPTKTIVHRMQDVVNESGMNALQLYAQNFKQADLGLTGTARKALLVSVSSKVTTPLSAPINPPPRWLSATSAIGVGSAHQRSPETLSSGSSPEPEDKVCITCGSSISPKWWRLDKENHDLVNGHGNAIGEEAMKFLTQRTFQCHKCKKAKRRPIPIVPPKSSPKGSPRPVEPPLTISTPRTSVPILASPPPQPPPQPSRSETHPNPIQPPFASPWLSPQTQQQAPPPSATLSAPLPMSGQAHPPSHAPIQPPIQTPIQPPAQSPIHPPMQSGSIQPPRTSSMATLPPTLAHAPHSSVSTTLPPYSGSSFGDWPSRPPSQQPTAVHPLNGNRSPASRHRNLAAPNHLRPPPVSTIPPPPLQNGLIQPMTNGLPPSPRRLSHGPSSQLSGGSYLHPFPHNPLPHSSHGSPLSHHSHQSHPSHSPPPHHGSIHGSHSIGGGTLNRDPYPGLINSRPPYTSSHGSPPISREQLSRETMSMSRDGPIPPPRSQDSRPSPIPPRPQDTRNSGGASSSASLRNLLS